MLCEFPIAAVANGKCQWLKTIQVYSLTFLEVKSKMGLFGLKSRCWRATVLLEALEENPFPRLFQLLETTHIPWLLAPFSIFKVNRRVTSNLSSIITSLSLTFVPPSFS